MAGPADSGWLFGGGAVMSVWGPEKIQMMAEQVNSAHIHSRDQASSWQRWVMAALLSINGGAAAAVLSFDDISRASQFWSVLWFSAGACFAIIFGMVSSKLNERSGRYYRSTAWTLTNRALGDESKRVDADILVAINRQERIVFWVQLLPLLSFLAGIVIAAEGIT